MRFLPIVGRELRVAARRRSTYALRLIAATAAFSVTLWLCLLPTHGLPPSALGKSLFTALSVMAFAYCLLIGPFITADCISAEKRDGTLGLLFLADLRSLDVVLGKWTAASLTGLYGLVAVLPSLGIPLLLGGITPGEYGRTALAVVNAILFSLTAGMLVSTLSRDQTKAILGTLILALALSGLLPGIMALFLKGFWGSGLSGYPPAALASPIYCGQFALDPSFRMNPKLFWHALLTIHLLCWGFMGATMLLVSRVWRMDPVESATPPPWLLRFGRTVRWQRKLEKRLERNPVYSVAGRHRWPHWVFWALVAIVAINIYWLTFGALRNPAAFQFHEQFGTAMIFINRVWIAAMACRFLVEARRDGALELILTTPISVQTVRSGRRRALVRLFFWPVMAIAVLHWIFVWGTWRPMANQPNSALILRLQSMLAAGSLISFLTDVLALTAVGGWFSLSSVKTRFAVLKTFAYVILVPWLLLFLMNRNGLLPRFFPQYPFLVQPAAFVTKNLLFLAWATYKVRKHFRAAAAQTYGLK
jgi:hypothetical protein